MLTADQTSQFQEQGFVLASGIFADDELDQMEREFDQELVIAAYRKILGDIASGSHRSKAGNLFPTA